MIVVVSPVSVVMVVVPQVACAGYCALQVASAGQRVVRAPWLMPKIRRAPQQSVWWAMPAQFVTAVAFVGYPLVGKPVHSLPGLHTRAPSELKAVSRGRSIEASGMPPAIPAAAS